MVSVCLPSDALLQHLPSYLGFSYLGLGVSLNGCSSWKRSVFIPIPKKRNTKECSNYHTIALISHTSKVMLKMLQARLQQYVNHELPDVQAGFRKGRGTRDESAKNCSSLGVRAIWWMLVSHPTATHLQGCHYLARKAEGCFLHNITIFAVSEMPYNPILPLLNQLSL